MEGMGYYIAGGALWILAAAYLVWRIRRSRKRRMPPPPEMTWLIYLVVFTLGLPLCSLVGRENRNAGIAVLAVTFAVSFSLSYWALGRYRKWLAEQEGKKEADR